MRISYRYIGLPVLLRLIRSATPIKSNGVLLPSVPDIFWVEWMYQRLPIPHTGTCKGLRLTTPAH